MIHVVIGQSASGKTTFVKKKFLKDGMKFEAKPIKHTYDSKTCLIGDYTKDDRCLGTDTLPYNSLPKIIDFVRLSHKKFSDIVLEGDRINNRRFFTFLAMLPDVTVYYLSCSLPTSMKRLRAADSKISERFVKSTITKSRNMFLFAKERGLKCVVLSDSIHQNPSST